jgi:transposase
VTALAFVLTLGPVERFPRNRQVVSYPALNPREHSSGDCQRLGSISKQGNVMLRWLLVEAAQSSFVRFAQASSSGRSGEKAILAANQPEAFADASRLHNLNAPRLSGFRFLADL